MSIELISDIVEGATATATREGVQLTRMFQVMGLEGSNSAAKTVQALYYSGVPRPGEPHPDLTDVSATNVSVDFQGPTMARVTVQYAQDKAKEKAPNSDPAQVSVGATLQTTVTTNDSEGKTVFVNFTRPSVPAGPGGTPAEVAAVEYDPQPGEVQIQVPCVVLRYTRKELGSPQKKAMEYVGTVNEFTFAGQDERKWLCTRIDGVSNDNGKSYVVDYEFQFKENTWDVTAFYIDRATNYLPELPNEYVFSETSIPFGKKTFQAYRKKDFKKLALGDNAGNTIGTGIAGSF